MNTNITELEKAELEKAELLLKLFKEHKDLFKSGLCNFINHLHVLSFINNETYYQLYVFIKNNNPTYELKRIWYSMFRKENKNLYYFKPGNYKRRLRFLESLVKKYSK